MAETPQNIYDDPAFFAGYAALRANPASANSVLIDPARDALMPDLAGKRVLDLGCGAGGFCRQAIAQGAVSVTGIDISERMLAAAQEQTPNSATDPRLRYVRSSLETFEAPTESADVIVSILALHYLADVGPLLQRIGQALAPGGTFLLCVEHPITTARRDANGWIKDTDGTKLYWALDNYSEEGVRPEEWFVPGVLRYHRTLSTYLNTILAAGLRLTAISEPVPDEKTVATFPSFASEGRRPLFLFVRAVKDGPR